MGTPLPITFQNLPIGLTPLSLLDEQFAASTDGAYFKDESIPDSALAATTGSGAVVLADSPALVTPDLGTPTALNLANALGLPVAGGGTGGHDIPTARSGLGNMPYEANTLAGLMALTLVAGDTVSLSAAGLTGAFLVVAGNFTSQVTADITNGIYVPLHDDPTGAVKCAIRQFSGTAQISWWSPPANGVGDDRPAFQSAYNVLDADTLLNCGEGTYTLTTVITLSGTKRLMYNFAPNCRWTTTVSQFYATGGASANYSQSNLWRAGLEYSDCTTASGGAFLLNYTRAANAATSYESDALRVYAINQDPNSGPTWGGTGTNTAKSMVAATFYAQTAPGNLTGSTWAGLDYAWVPNGADGFANSREIDIDIGNTVATVKSLTSALRKGALQVVSFTSPATFAIYFGAANGGGFYHGVSIPQSALVNDTVTRAFEVPNVFGVAYDGHLFSGKNATNLFTAGVELLPGGSIYQTSTGGAAIHDFARTETLSSTPVQIGLLNGYGVNSASSAIPFVNIAIDALNGTAGAEAGETIFSNYVAGAQTIAMSLANGMTVGTPTGSFKGTGTANFAGDIYKNNTAYTNPDYVLEMAYRGEIVQFADKEGAAAYRGMMSLDALRAYTRENLRLPGISDEPMGLFERGDKVLEKLEEITLYLLDLNDRMNALESRAA